MRIVLLAVSLLWAGSVTAFDKVNEVLGNYGGWRVAYMNMWLTDMMMCSMDIYATDTRFNIYQQSEGPQFIIHHDGWDHQYQTNRTVIFEFDHQRRYVVPMDWENDFVAMDFNYTDPAFELFLKEMAYSKELDIYLREDGPIETGVLLKGFSEALVKFHECTQTRPLG